MSDEIVNELTRRVAIAELDAAHTRAQIQELIRDEERRRVSVRRTGVLMLAVLILAVVVVRSREIEAQAGPQVMTVRAPFVVVDGTGKPIMRVVDAGGTESRGMNIYDPQGLVVASSIVNANGKGVVGAFDGNNTAGLGFSPQGDGHLIISRADGKFLADIGKDLAAFNTPITITDSAGKSIMRVGDARGADSRGMNIYDTKGQVVASSIVNANGKGVVGAFDGNKTAGLGFSADGDGHLMINRADGTLLADIGKDVVAFNTAVTVGDGPDKPVVKIDWKVKDARGIQIFGESGSLATSLSAGAKGGAVTARNLTGVPVAGLFASDSGGGMALTGREGGNSAVSLSVGGTGGKVQVFPPGGGSAQAELTANDTGGRVSVYSSSGTPAAMLQSTSTGAGRLEIGLAGQVMVEAGVLPSGVGVVRAGPTMGGPPGGGLSMPFAIMGKK
jgi:hypothetical protein